MEESFGEVMKSKRKEKKNSVGDLSVVEVKWNEKIRQIMRTRSQTAQDVLN